MTGSNLLKLGRVIGSRGNPRHLYLYAMRGRSRGTTLELGLHRFSWSAIEFLHQFVAKTTTISEYGTGGSTLYFARRAGFITSTEDNSISLQRVREELRAKAVKNVELQDRPFDFHLLESFTTSAYLNSIPDAAFNIFVIDGTVEAIPVRPACFEHAKQRARPDTIIIVDDSWRYPGLRRNSRAKSWREFRSTGPCWTGVTSTDIHFY